MGDHVAFSEHAVPTLVNCYSASMWVSLGITSVNKLSQYGLHVDLEGGSIAAEVKVIHKSSIKANGPLLVFMYKLSCRLCLPHQQIL